MKYISKGPEPLFLTQFKKLQTAAGIPATYDTFGTKGNKASLNDKLRAEQHNICCYCQRRIDHYLGDKSTGAHNEHLNPQSLDPGDGSIDLDYNNIYACCISSQGMKKQSQHCGESKKNIIIEGSIAKPDCDLRFKYNLVGEILPAGEYLNWDKYLDNYNNLPKDIQLLVDEIKVLNLNCNSLVSERKKVIDSLVNWIKMESPDEIAARMEQIDSDSSYPIFYSMLKYFIERIFNSRA